MDPVVIDRLGNNVLIECNECHDHYIIGSPPIYRKPRACPHCGKTQGFVDPINGITVERVPNAE